MSSVQVWINIVLVLFVVPQYQAESETHDLEAKLINDLIKNYSSIYVRPQRNPVIVGFRFSPTILTLDESSEELQLKGMLVLIWEDDRLTWDPEEYGSLNKTQIPLVEDGRPILWKPELVLEESTDKDSNNFHAETNLAKLFYNGTIQWYTLAMTTSFCRVDIKRFPFDKQTCRLTFTTWLYQTGEQIFYLIDDIIHKKSYKKYKKRSGVWDYTLSNPLVGNASYDCPTCYDHEQSYVQYNLLLTRTNHVWYMMNYMFPCGVLTTMTVIIPCLSHKKEVDAPSFGLTCVLTLFVFLAFLFTQLPATGPPGMGFYIVLLIIEAVLATIYVTVKVPKIETEDQADIPSTNEPTGDPGADDFLEIQDPKYRNLSRCRIWATRTIESLKQCCCKNPCKTIAKFLIFINISSGIVFCALLFSWYRNESK